MVTDLEDPKTHTVGGVWSREYMDHGFTKSMKEFNRCYTLLQGLCFVIIGGALIHKNCEGSKHEGRRIRPTIGDFGGNYASNQSPFNNGRIREYEEENKEDRVPTTKIFRLKILINNSVCSLLIDGCSINNLVSRKLIDFLKLPMEICPIEGYHDCRVLVTKEKFYKVEVFCIADNIDEWHILFGRPWRCEAEVVEDHSEKIQDLQSYKQHDDNISTLSFGTTNKVGTLKTCKEIMGFNDDEDVKGFDCELKVDFECVHDLNVHDLDYGLILRMIIKNHINFSMEYGRRVEKYEGFRVDVKRKSIEDKIRREKVFDVDEPLDIENHEGRFFLSVFQEEDEFEYAEPLDGEAEQHYNELVTCDVVNMEACHVLLGRPWKHDMDATHQGKSNMYLFKWSGKTIAMLSLVVVPPKTKLKNKTLVTLVASPKEFQAERMETGFYYALVVKGVEYAMENAISTIIKPLLPDFGKIVTDDTPNALPPLRNIQH
ncbi:hypothetical protein Tco_0470982 [Tanacetum coccineum]